MLNNKVLLLNRVKEFINNLNFSELKTTRTIAICIGWFLTTHFLLFSLNQNIGWLFVWIFINGYFWVQLNKIILSKIKPMMELIILLLLLFLSLDILIISNSINQFESVFLRILHSSLLAFIILISGLVLIINSQKNISYKSFTKGKIKQGVLIGYTIFGYLAHTLVFYDHIYYLYLWQIFLFIFLLKKTRWLELLTKSELYYYLIGFLILFYIFDDNSIFQEIIKQQTSQSVLWISLPYYLFLFFKIYLLVLAVKVPIVIIYNHASLSRKLEIAGIFQSTVPQILQFILLIFAFYFFIANWQANKLKSVIDEEIENITDGRINPNITFYHFDENKDESTYSITGYENGRFKNELPRLSITSFIKTGLNKDIDYFDYFLTVHVKDSVNNDLYFIRIDSTFIAYLSQKLSVVAGNGLLAYPYSIKEWQKSVYNISFWQDDQSIKIFLFGLLSNNKGNFLQSEFPNDDPELDIDIIGVSTLSGDRKLIAGRIYLPFINDNSTNTHFAIDIYFHPYVISFSSSFAAKILLVLIIIFLLFNFFITNRVVKFGDEIRQMIVQKFNKLKTGIREISSGNLDYKVELDGQDEFVEFANRFNQMGDKLQQTITDLREKDRLDHELQIARNVQLSLLPDNIPNIPGYELAFSLETAAEVGGDFYDIVALNENKYLFTIGDVSGKGSSAAFYMAQFISLLRYSIQYTNKPEEIAVRLNNYFISHVMDRQIFITAIIGLLDIKQNKITMVRAGHNLPILIPGNEKNDISEISSSGLGFGLTKNNFEKSLKVEKFSLKSGDKILLYTDGVIEAAYSDPNKKIQTLGEEKLITTLKQNRSMNAKNVVESITRELKIFYGTNPIVDDYTILLLERNKSPQ